MLQATVVYHELYGLSLNILDIDPNYALGVLAREKQETIQKLQKEGLFYLNKKLPFPLLPRRLALISVESSKGLADFTQVLDKNPWHYRILYTLFPALLQGDRASQSIINQLENIKKSLDSYDAVAIIRGGGGDVGLSCYNNYTLSKAISNFPLPVLTGIGHATNETVSEMVAFKSAITPSMLADFILQQFHLASQPLLDAELTLRRKAFDRMATEKEALDILKKQMKSACYNRLKFAQADLDNLHRQGVRASINVFRNEERKLNALDKQLLILNPFNTLKRGYSITYFQGIPLRNSSLVTQGDVLEIQLEAGRLKAIVSENNN